MPTTDRPATLGPAATTAGAPVLPAGTRLGPVQLAVADHERALAFYASVLGYREHGRDGELLRLGTGEEDLLVLRERRDLRPAGRHVGLYHVALNAPSRAELARTAVRLAASRTPIQGASDHHTHEAIYLADPDGNGLELAADRPRADWPGLDEAYDLDARPPRPLDVPALLDVVADEPPRAEAGPGAFVGHLHLHVGDLEAAERFWTELVGFERQARLSNAAFVSAGGYHHHVAVNTWRGSAPRPANTAGLDHATILAPAEAVSAAGERLRAGGVATEELADGGLRTADPAGNAVELRPLG